MQYKLLHTRYGLTYNITDDWDTFCDHGRKNIFTPYKFKSLKNIRNFLAMNYKIYQYKDYKILQYDN